jgi:hypothetical protein
MSAAVLAPLVTRRSPWPFWIAECPKWTPDCSTHEVNRLDGVLCWPKATRQNFVDECAPRARWPVAVNKTTATDQRCAKRSQIAGADDSKTHDRVLAIRQRRTTGKMESCAEPPPQKRSRIHHGGVAHLGKPVKAAKHVLAARRLL